jgi:hypothetical protein
MDKMTSGASVTNSVANFRLSSGLAPGRRKSMRKLRPSVQPNCCKPCTKVRIAIHPTPLASLADLWERAAIGPIPGGLVVAAGVLFHGAWAMLALVTYRIEIASRRERRSLIAMG